MRMASESADISIESSGDQERRVNIYGSFVADEELMADVEVEAAKAEVHENVICQCKGLCARKSGRGSCACKASGKGCTEQCRCNLAKCRNRTTGSNQQANPTSREADGEAQFRNEMETAAAEIQAFVTGLDTTKKDELLVNLLCMGRGSLDFARNLIGAGGNPPATPGPSPEWCKCGCCRLMETETENKCCDRVNCVTKMHSFSNICLDRDILEVCIKSRCDFRSDEFDFSMESFRKAGYRQFVMWRFGKLGRGNRRVLPSCVVWAIRDSFPSATGRYMGFRSS